MMNQKYWTTFNSSATLEFKESEIDIVSRRIFEAIQTDEGYISAALLSRIDDLQTFPRLPFEPISRERYEELVQDVQKRRVTEDFEAAMRKYDLEVSESARVEGLGGMACDSDKCLIIGSN